MEYYPDIEVCLFKGVPIDFPDTVGRRVIPKQAVTVVYAVRSSWLTVMALNRNGAILCTSQALISVLPTECIGNM